MSWLISSKKLFPLEHEYLIHESGANERSKKLETYFDKLLRFPPFRDHPAIVSIIYLLFHPDKHFIQIMDHCFVAQTIERITTDLC